MILLTTVGITAISGKEEGRSNKMDNEILKMLDEKTKIAFTVVWLNQIQKLTEKIKIMWEKEDERQIRNC